MAGDARLFVAITIPDAVREHLGAVVSSLVPRVPDLRWTQPQLWHLTLAFFGGVPDRRRPDLLERLARVAGRHPPMPLQLRGGGVFGRPDRASVVWVGVDAGRALPDLAAGCAAAGRHAGLAMEKRPYRAHLTLARARGRTGADARAVVEELAEYAGPPWRATDIVLLHSHLGAHPRYEPVAQWNLAAGYQA
jgi:2'-5' RNA ligase